MCIYILCITCTHAYVVPVCYHVKNHLYVQFSLLIYFYYVKCTTCIYTYLCLVYNILKYKIIYIYNIYNIQ